ncbi:MAG: hypothetical protein KGZ30_02810 [Anaplasmataceae bacterium]|nr:hypothetical protein [Anaplasmataceae bacterium]
MKERSAEGERFRGPVTAQMIFGLAWRKPRSAADIAQRVTRILEEVAERQITAGEGEDELRDVLAEIDAA